jgi:hypothetical protein
MHLVKAKDPFLSFGGHRFCAVSIFGAAVRCVLPASRLYITLASLTLLRSPAANKITNTGELRLELNFNRGLLGEKGNL